MRCDQCKNWTAHASSSLGTCGKAKPWWQVSGWEESGDFFDRIILPEFKDLKMFVQDGSDYRAFLFTTPDFFCAHFEKKQG